jgi:hypothetical protein
LSDVDRLLQEIGAAQDLADLAALEHATIRLIEELAARLNDATRERREYLNPR